MGHRDGDTSVSREKREMPAEADGMGEGVWQRLGGCERRMARRRQYGLSLWICGEGGARRASKPTDAGPPLLRPSLFFTSLPTLPVHWTRLGQGRSSFNERGW